MGMIMFTQPMNPEGLHWKLNIKITTPGDFYIFRALVDVRENSQIFGI